MSELVPNLKQRYFDHDGAPLVGGKLYSYYAGTSTPLVTYTDDGALSANTNPIILDANGECSVWIITNSYKFILTDSADVVQWTVDQVKSQAMQLNIEGALAVVNNLSDVADAAQSVRNLGISPPTYQAETAITSGQAATNLNGASFDGATYSSIDCVAEVTQGTTVNSKVFFTVAYLNSVWILVLGETRDNGTAMGVTFSLGTQVGAVVNLKAAESGVGNGKVKIQKTSFYAVT